MLLRWMLVIILSCTAFGVDDKKDISLIEVLEELKEHAGEGKGVGGVVELPPPTKDETKVERLIEESLHALQPNADLATIAAESEAVMENITKLGGVAIEDAAKQNDTMVKVVEEILEVLEPNVSTSVIEKEAVDAVSNITHFVNDAIEVQSGNAAVIADIQADLAKEGNSSVVKAVEGVLHILEPNVSENKIEKDAVEAVKTLSTFVEDTASNLTNLVESISPDLIKSTTTHPPFESELKRDLNKIENDPVIEDAVEEVLHALEPNVTASEIKIEATEAISNVTHLIGDAVGNISSLVDDTLKEFGGNGPLASDIKEGLSSANDPQIIDKIKGIVTKADPEILVEVNHLVKDITTLVEEGDKLIRGGEPLAEEIKENIQKIEKDPNVINVVEDVLHALQPDVKEEVIKAEATDYIGNMTKNVETNLESATENAAILTAEPSTAAKPNIDAEVVKDLTNAAGAIIGGAEDLIKLGQPLTEEVKESLDKIEKDPNVITAVEDALHALEPEVPPGVIKNEAIEAITNATHFLEDAVQISTGNQTVLSEVKEDLAKGEDSRVVHIVEKALHILEPNNTEAQIVTEAVEVVSNITTFVEDAIKFKNETEQLQVVPVVDALERVLEVIEPNKKEPELRAKAIDVVTNLTHFVQDSLKAADNETIINELKHQLEKKPDGPALAIVEEALHILEPQSSDSTIKKEAVEIVSNLTSFVHDADLVAPSIEFNGPRVETEAEKVDKEVEQIEEEAQRELEIMLKKTTPAVGQGIVEEPKTEVPFIGNPPAAGVDQETKDKEKQAEPKTQTQFINNPPAGGVDQETKDKEKELEPKTESKIINNPPAGGVDQETKNKEKELEPKTESSIPVNNDLNKLTVPIATAPTNIPPKLATLFTKMPNIEKLSQSNAEFGHLLKNLCSSSNPNEEKSLLQEIEKLGKDIGGEDGQSIMKSVLCYAKMKLDKAKPKWKSYKHASSSSSSEENKKNPKRKSGDKEKPKKRHHFRSRWHGNIDGRKNNFLFV
uniref:DUF148 domain-containing protein n=1 Tax=Rhabditophanes sp. KR3021 TaxID=114890 RepID=A0AC35TVX9_9BILA